MSSLNYIISKFKNAPVIETFNNFKPLTDKSKRTLTQIIIHYQNKKDLYIYIGDKCRHKTSKYTIKQILEHIKNHIKEYITEATKKLKNGESKILNDMLTTQSIINDIENG